MKLKNLKISFIFVFSLLAVFSSGLLKVKGENKADLSTVSIAMALDDGYTYPTIVSITSMMENKNSDTVYDYYIMHSGEFKEENKEKLKSLERKYKGCRINLIDMQDKYKDSRSDTRITTPTYYRLSLSELLPDLDKIIWLDGDTLVFSDLNEMYNIDMEGYYYKGFLDDGDIKYLLVKENDHPICAGVMLLNLKELRKDDMVNKFANFIRENNNNLYQHDQTVINSLCYKKIGILPAKYGLFNYYSNAEEIRWYINILRCEEKYSVGEVVEASKNPVVLHCVSKPWKRRNVHFGNKWWEYAKKTDYYEEILKKYPIF